MWRLLAQRPLPSMMIATWRGTALTSGTSIVELVCLTMDFIDEQGSGQQLHRHDFLFLINHNFVDVDDGFVGHLLNVIGSAALFVLGNFFIFSQAF